MSENRNTACINGPTDASLFGRCGYDAESVADRVAQVWYEIFEGPDKFYWENAEGLGYVMDTGNEDVRTEECHTP
uniref:CAZy families GH8 protein n=1 Tax=uncultured Bifidobacterium sp. TaxID=165187 RepID=A0A060BPG1_9BIFI|nr:CAZy families GH8 protein [uncultured Bifidobacterium sp.]